MSNKKIPEEQIQREKQEILAAYKDLISPGHRTFAEKDIVLIRKAFDIAVESHSQMRRKSGEPYISHPISVAKIVKDEIGLGATSIACALLHDVVEDTDLSLEDIQLLFGDEVVRIVDGLTKISEIFDTSINLQAENFKKLLLTLAEDVRVIFIKIADRLHNMRTLESMPEEKRTKIASETLALFAPLAHRLGLHSIKIEMEDLSLKQIEPDVYNEIFSKLEKSKAVRTRFLNHFTLPIRRSLDEAGFKYRILGRTKSIYSIYQKMKRQNVPFEEVYDILAVRVILDSEREEEKADCWKVYSLVTDYYIPNPDRLRDWVSSPKANGYESLHITVMSPTGKWVEVQIRTERMDDIAEHGYAAHWKYKSEGQEHAVDQWLERIRETLLSKEIHSEDFIRDFKLNLFEEEIMVFTPRGDLITLPWGATPVDFAYEIHTQIGNTCIGAKVNSQLVPLSYQLNSGDQVEIITSAKSKPTEEWLRFVRSAKARSIIKQNLKGEKKKVAVVGRAILKKKLAELNIKPTLSNYITIAYFYNLSTVEELLYEVKKGRLDLSLLHNLKIEKGKIKDQFRKSKNSIISNIGGQADYQTAEDHVPNAKYTLALCCNPIPGDRVLGIIEENNIIEIHRVNCQKAIDFQSSFHNRVVQAKWTTGENLAYLAGVRVEGIDQVGLVNDITHIISQDMNVNMKSLKFDSQDGYYNGEIQAYVSDTEHLNALIKKLSKVRGVHKVERFDTAKNNFGK